MSNERIRISRRKALVGLGSIGLASAGAGLGTYAQFTDQEENEVTFTAGGIDGTIAWNGSYNSQPIDGERSHVTLGDIGIEGHNVRVDAHLEDLKPGDYGCVNFTLNVTNNPAWTSSSIVLLADSDGKTYEPEREVDTPGAVPDAFGNGKGDEGNADWEQGGELAESIYVLPYYDSDNSCQFFDPDGSADGVQSSVSAPYSFWDNAQPEGDDPNPGDNADPAPISVGQDDNNEYRLVPKSLAEHVGRDFGTGTEGVDTAHWNDENSDLEIQNAPDGSSVSSGTVMLDGNGSASSTNNTHGVAPLQPDTTLNFGYDFYFPFESGNVTQGDKLSLSFLFTFLQHRHTEAPNFGSYSPGSNTPNNTDTPS